MQLPGFVAFLQTLGDGEAPGPAMIGEGVFGTSPPVCSGDSWGVSCPPCPAASARAQAWPPSIRLLIAPALTTRFLNRGLMTTH